MSRIHAWYEDVVDEETGVVTQVRYERPYTQQEEDEADAREAAYAAIVPEEVTPYQARVALLNAGLLDEVEAFMQAEGTPRAAKIAWEYATVWQRNSPFIATLGPALGLTEAQVDDLFRFAAGV